MREMTREEFEREKDAAAKRIREMYKGQNSPSFPSFVALPQPPEPPPEKKPSAQPVSPPEKFHQNIFKFLNFSEISKSPDSLLILGIILLLIGDNADEKLILALIFIML